MLVDLLFVLPTLAMLLFNGSGREIWGAESHQVSLDQNCPNPDPPREVERAELGPDGLYVVCSALWHTNPNSNGLQPKSDGLQPNSEGLQPISDGLQPTSDGLHPSEKFKSAPGASSSP